MLISLHTLAIVIGALLAIITWQKNKKTSILTLAAMFFLALPSLYILLPFLTNIVHLNEMYTEFTGIAFLLAAIFWR